MIVPFSEINPKTGQSTFFIEKIWECILPRIADKHGSLCSEQYLQYQQAYLEKFGKYWDGTGDMWHDPVNPKLHTIRRDEKNRYQPDKLIHPFINNRTKNMFGFAPPFPVISTQKIEIKHTGFIITVFVDGKDVHQDISEQIAKNDGFDSLLDFFKWFDTDYTGKIIHFTELKY